MMCLILHCAAPSKCVHGLEMYFFLALGLGLFFSSLFRLWSSHLKYPKKYKINSKDDI